MRFLHQTLMCSAFFFQLFPGHIRGQDLSKEYSALITKGRQFYFSKDYNNAAATFSKAFQLAGDKTPVIDRHRVAFSFALSGNADSAFFYLDNITRMPVLTFEDFIRIVPDEDYKSIHKDTRWESVTNLIFNKANNDFHRSLHEGIIMNSRRVTAAASWAIRKNADSVFYQLYKMAESPGLTFDDVYQVQDNYYLQEYKTTLKWQEFIDRAHTALSKKYIPVSAFSKSSPKKNTLH